MDAQLKSKIRLIILRATKLDAQPVNPGDIVATSLAHAKTLLSGVYPKARLLADHELEQLEPIRKGGSDEEPRKPRKPRKPKA